MGCEHEVEFAQKLAEIDQRAKSNSKRLNELSELVSVVHELSTAMRLMAEDLKRTAESVAQLDTKITVIEQLPAKRWAGIAEKILVAAISVAVGWLLSKIGIAA